MINIAPIRWLMELLFGPSLPKITKRTIDPLGYITTNYLVETSILTSRRFDYPLPDGYLASDSVLLNDGRVLQTFQHWPYKESSVARGDGGQILSVGPDGWVRIDQTRDGGKPYMQYFIGPKCRGTGWIAFGADAYYSWKNVVATLEISNWSEYKTKALNKAFTRYKRATVLMPWAVDGVKNSVPLDVIISEHYDSGTIKTSTTLERSYFAWGIGLVRWEAWDKTPEVPVLDMGDRYFHVLGSDAPEPGWYVNDIRTWTNVKTVEPTPVPVMS